MMTYHVYERAGADPADRLAVLSDDDWERLTPPQRASHRLRTGGFRTALEAVVRMLELTESDPHAGAPDVLVAGGKRVLVA